MKSTAKELTSRDACAPCRMVMGIHRSYGYDCEGEVWHPYQAKPIYFRSLMQAIGAMARLMDELDFPQRATLPRSFFVKENTEENRKRVIRKKQIMTNSEDKSGKKGTFIVQVMYRQGTTWQGQVTWAEQDKKVYFRSALELVRLIDDAMNGQEKRSSFLPPAGGSAGEDET